MTSEVEQLQTQKAPQLPLADGTMYSRRRGVCPSAPPFVNVPIEEYTPLVGELKMERLRDAAEALRGFRIMELNSTPLGGGVAEMLLSSVPFLTAAYYRNLYVRNLRKSLVARERFELSSAGPEPAMLDHYTTGLLSGSARKTFHLPNKYLTVVPITDDF